MPSAADAGGVISKFVETVAPGAEDKLDDEAAVVQPLGAALWMLNEFAEQPAALLFVKVRMNDAEPPAPIQSVEFGFTTTVGLANTQFVG